MPTVSHRTLALPCDANGQYLPPHSGPPPPPAPPLNGLDPAAWSPFSSRAEFDFAHYHFVELQTSERNINTALDLWAASVMPYGGTAPWKNAAELYAVIDDIQNGSMPWKTYQMRYTGPLPADPHDPARPLHDYPIDPILCSVQFTAPPHRRIHRYFSTRSVHFRGAMLAPPTVSASASGSDAATSNTSLHQPLLPASNAVPEQRALRRVSPGVIPFAGVFTGVSA
ncbi:hypothetical protein C8R44DRAFT_888825 [Mycena epipterygia]|nr:hypothetical protein C8R44DRAFT_888825 [Mycena epipterygia]